MADQSNIFMTVQGVTGEATSTNYPKWIRIDSFSIGASNPVSANAGTSGLSGGTPTLSSFNVAKSTDASSCDLFKGLTKGTHFATANVVCLKSGQDTGVYLQYDFTDVMCESIQWAGSGGSGGTASESASFAYAQVQVTYFAQDDSGNLSKSGMTSYNVLTQVTS